MRLGRRRRRAVDFEIAPEEVILDSENRGGFDKGQMEGRLEKPLAKSSFALLGIGLCLLVLVLISQAWNLQVMQGTAYAEQSAHNSLFQETVFASRGNITDRNGVPLATNDPTATSSDEGFVRRIYKTPGYGNVLGYVSYPKKDTSGNFYDTEEKGVAGVEAAFNTALSGVNGSLLVERDARGQIQSQGTLVPAQDGTKIALSIDSRAQAAFYDAISSLADKIPFAGGAGILMDVQNGEILALVSYPEYDSNVLSSGGPSATIASYATDNRHVYLNRPVQGLYTPGSVVKPLEAAGALQDGVITPGYTINDTGSISVPNPYDPSHPNIFVDWKVIGIEDLRKAIAFSSDVYFYTVGGGYGPIKGLGINRLDYWYDTFGLTAETGIELPGENSGFVPTPEWKQKIFNENWNIGDTYHTAIGQYSMQVTPLEEARAIAAIANGGKLMKPTLLASSTPSFTQLPIDAEHLQVVREGMHQGVYGGGTSQGLSDLTYADLAGKTGTAQTGTRNQYYNSWAVGFFPFTAPKYAYVIMMEKGPAGNLYGAVYAAHQALEDLHRFAPEYFDK